MVTAPAVDVFNNKIGWTVYTITTTLKQEILNVVSLGGLSLILDKMRLKWIYVTSVDIPHLPKK